VSKRSPAMQKDTQRRTCSLSLISLWMALFSRSQGGSVNQLVGVSFVQMLAWSMLPRNLKHLNLFYNDSGLQWACFGTRFLARSDHVVAVILKAIFYVFWSGIWQMGWARTKLCFEDLDMTLEGFCFMTPCSPSGGGGGGGGRWIWSLLAHTAN